MATDPDPVAIGTPFNFTKGVTPSTRIGTPFNFLKGVTPSTRIGTPFSYVQEIRVRVGSPRAKQLNVDAPLQVFVTTVSGLPSAVGLQGHYAYVSNALGGGVLVFSDNLIWRRWTDRVVVS